MDKHVKIENANGPIKLSDSLRMMSRFMADPRLSADVLLAANTLDSLVEKLEIYEGTTGEHVSCSGVVEDMAGTIEFLKEKIALLEKDKKT